MHIFALISSSSYKWCIVLRSSICHPYCRYNSNTYFWSIHSYTLYLCCYILCSQTKDNIKTFLDEYAYAMKTHFLLYVHTTMMYRKRLSKQTPHIYYVLKVKSFTAQGIFIGFPREWIAFVMLMWHSWRTSGNNKLFLSFSFSEIVQYCFFLPVFCPAYIIIIVIILIIMMCIDKWSMHKWKVGGCTSKCWLDWSFCIKPYNKSYLSGFKCITVFPRHNMPLI